uniref:Uncharacterized protein n=1 Tax=Trypanosoma vivax (strain Y486) TaxID=1055687 RepID=G0UCR1_TRYVY|nr:hypothetical protein TVY486_1111050 [Trypanosoma vivax Y486]
MFHCILINCLMSLDAFKFLLFLSSLSLSLSLIFFLSRILFRLLGIIFGFLIDLARFAPDNTSPSSYVLSHSCVGSAVKPHVQALLVVYLPTFLRHRLTSIFHQTLACVHVRMHSCLCFCLHFPPSTSCLHIPSLFFLPR